MKKLSLDSRTQRFRTSSPGGGDVTNKRGLKLRQRGDDFGVRKSGSGGRRVSSETPAGRVQQQGRRSGSGFGSVLGGFGVGRMVKTGAVVALMALTAGPAMADYVRLDQAQPQVVESQDVRPNVTASTAASEAAFDANQLKNYGMFKLFWESDVEGTAQQGVWSLSPEGAGHLLEYARTHNLDGEDRASPSDRAGPIDVTAGHQALVEYLLTSEYYSAFISQEAIPILRAGFDLPEVQVAAQPQHEPVDHGEVRIATDAQWWGSKGIQGWAIRNLPSAMATEYQYGSRVGRYDGAASTIEQKKYELASLLNQFATALNRWDDLALVPKDQIKHQLQDQMLDTFFKLPVLQGNGEEAQQLRRFFATDFNGSGMGLAQAIVKGFDGNSFPTEFPNASGRGSPVTMSLSTSNLRDAITTLDRILEVGGWTPGAIALKDKPAINYMVGEESGHGTKSFNERNPPLDKLNYGKMLMVGSPGEGFRQDPRLRDVLAKSGFSFPIDAITATGQAVIAGPGTELHVHRASDKQRLSVEVQIQEEDGEAKSYTLVFKDSAGEVVEPKDVVGLLKRYGRTLGDGHANQSLETGYWGRCDDNTGANNIFGRFGHLPKDFVGQRDGTVYLRVNGNIIGVPQKQARELVYMDLPGIGQTENPVNAGYRFGYDPSEISWSRGGWDYKNFGVIEGFNPSPFTQSHHRFVSGDMLRIDNTPQHPMQGSLRLTVGSNTQTVDATHVQFIMQRGEQIKVTHGEPGKNYVYSKTGTSLTDVSSIDWSQARPVFMDDNDAPGRKVSTGTVEAGTTIQAWFESQNLAEEGITLADLLRANPEIGERKADSVTTGEDVKIPELKVAVTADGETLDKLFTRYAELTGDTIGDLQRANADALAKLTTPVLEVGQVITLKVGEESVQHTVAEGETYQSILDAHATDTVSAADIDTALRASTKSLFTDWAKVTIPQGTELSITLPENSIESESTQTLSQFLAGSSLGELGVTVEKLREANPGVGGRVAGFVKSDEQIKVPELAVAFGEDNPFIGDFKMRRTDGEDIVVRADEVNYMVGETPHDVRFTHYLRFVQKSEGVFGNEGSLTRSISNARKWIDDVAMYTTRGADRPDWAGDKPLRGIQGPLERQAGDKMVFAAGTGKNSYNNGRTTTFVGWYQVDESTGRVLNEGFISGEPDFLWGIHDTKLNWHAESTYIGRMMKPDIRLGLFINAYPELRNQGEKADEIAEALNLPSNWRSYIVTDEQVEAHVNPPQPEQPEGQPAGDGGEQPVAETTGDGVEQQTGQTPEQPADQPVEQPSGG